MDDINRKNPPDFADTDAEFKHKAVENVETTAFCAVVPQSLSVENPNRSSDSILRAALDPKTIKLATKAVSERDRRVGIDGPKPADFGEHEPIPVEAVSMVPVAEGGEDK